jgi:hypothetical protein
MSAVPGALRDWAIGATAALVMATVVFVGFRNRELTERQRGAARDAAAALARGG